MRWMRARRTAACAVILVIICCLCGDAGFVWRNVPVPEPVHVERLLRALTAEELGSSQYRLRTLSGGLLAADATRRDDPDGWTAIHTLWRAENGAWRLLRLTRSQRRRTEPPPQ